MMPAIIADSAIYVNGVREKDLGGGSVVTGISGMNLRYMPELSWPLGYPLALCGMAAICVILYLLLRRSGWL